MKALEIARRRMRNSRLTGSAFHAPEEVVRWHGAMQAQDYGPAKWSIGQRAANLNDADVDRAVAEGSIVRTHVLRPTWHFVAREDIRWLLALTGPRIRRHIAPRLRSLGLDARTLARCERVIASAVGDGNRLTRDHIARVLDAARIVRSGQRLPHILIHCELEAVICSGGVIGKKQAYALFDERVPNGAALDRDDALIELVRRYLTSHGPATVKDLGWWASLSVTDIRNALHMLGSEVRSDTVGGMTFWSMATDGADAAPARGVHLLQVYDEVLVGYTQSRYFGDPRATEARAAWTDRTVPNGVVLRNGGVAGHWRRTLAKDSMTIDVVLYDGERRGDRRALETATSELGRFVGRHVELQVRSGLASGV